MQDKELRAANNNRAEFQDGLFFKAQVSIAFYGSNPSHTILVKNAHSAYLRTPLILLRFTFVSCASGLRCLKLNLFKLFVNSRQNCKRQIYLNNLTYT